MFKAVDLAEVLANGAVYSQIVYDHQEDLYRAMLLVEGYDDQQVIFVTPDADEAAERAIAEALLRRCPVKLSPFQKHLVEALAKALLR